MKNPIGWFEIYVEDMARAQKFYETVFGVKMSEMPIPESQADDMKMLSFPSEMSSYGASGTLVQMKGFKAGGNSTIIYFQSDDCAIEEGRVEKAGGSIFKAKESIGEFGFMALATDTEGNMFGIHSMK